jgi:hypothetical protein
MWLAVLVLVLAFPTGYLLAYLTRDELVQGRNWFKIIVLISAVSSIVFIFFNLTISLTLVFASIATIICLIKSYDKKFVK